MNNIKQAGLARPGSKPGRRSTNGKKAAGNCKIIFLRRKIISNTLEHEFRKSSWKGEEKTNLKYFFSSVSFRYLKNRTKYLIEGNFLLTPLFLSHHAQLEKTATLLLFHVILHENGCGGGRKTSEKIKNMMIWYILIVEQARGKGAAAPRPICPLSIK